MEISKTFVTIGANTAPLAVGLNQAKGMVATSTANMTKNLASVGKMMTVVGAIIVAGFGMAIKTAKQFEQSMANTASVAGATAEELKQLSDYAREMGEQSVFSASQAADGMYYLASAGMKTDEIMGALKGTLDLAAATASDLAFASESVAATLSQFGFAADEAGRVANVFAAAISGSQATMEKMTNSMSYVGPMAKSMGISLETTTGILMNLYNAGLDGSKAGTALRMAFVKLIDPTEKGIAALERLEIAVNDSTGEMRPFEDIIDELGIAGMSTADAMDIFGVRAGPAMMALVSQGTGAIREMTEAVTGTNKAVEMAGTQIDTFEGAMKLLKSAFEELQITLVQELMPALKGIIEWITEGIKKVTEWMKENPKLTETIVKWTAGIGALMLVLGPLLIILPGLVTGVGLFSTATIALTGTVGLAIINFVLWYNIIKDIDKILHSHYTSTKDVEDAYKNLSEAQKKAAEKLGITVEEFIKMQKEGRTVTEMLDPLISKYGDYTDALDVWTIAAVEQRVNAALIVTTVKDLASEMSLLTKEYEASNQILSENISYYTSMIELLNRTDIILQTELMLLQEGTEEWKKKKEEIASNAKALNDINAELAKLTEPLEGLDLIVAKMAALGDSTEDTKAKIILLNEQAVILKEKLDEAIPETEAWYDLNTAYQGTQTEIGNLTAKLSELTAEQNQAAEAAKTLADAYKTITDKIYELTHTPMENSIRKLDQQKQAYIDLGMEIGIVNKWYDLQIAKLNELNPELDKTTEKLKESGEAAKEAGDAGKDSWEGFTIVIKKATATLNNFTNEGLASAIATIKMRFFVVLKELRNTINNSTGIFKIMAEANLAALRKSMNEQIATVMYGLKVYNDALSQMEGGSPGAGSGTFTMPSYATGTPYVPQTGMALLHKGEAVIPANQNTNNSFSPTINLSVQGGGNAKNIAQEVENVLYNMGRQFKRRGFEIIPGRG